MQGRESGTRHCRCSEWPTCSSSLRMTGGVKMDIASEEEDNNYSDNNSDSSAEDLIDRGNTSTALVTSSLTLYHQGLTATSILLAAAH